MPSGSVTGVGRCSVNATPVNRPGSHNRGENLLAEGIPPIPVKWLDKVRRWEFMDLALLLD